MASRGWGEGETERCSMRRVSFADKSVPRILSMVSDVLGSLGDISHPWAKGDV